MPEYQMGHDEVLPEGCYDFACVDAEERTSQGGNTMIELELMVKGPDGKNGIRLYDHLTFVPKSYWKIDAFRVATGESLVPGQTARFEAEDCIDRQGKVWLTIETYQGRQRNKVGEYLDPNAENPPPAANASPKPPKIEKTLEEEFREKGADPDDDIPMT
jgi:hypothetical protein